MDIPWFEVQTLWNKEVGKTNPYCHIIYFSEVQQTKNDNVLQISDMRDVSWFKLETLTLNVMNEKKKKIKQRSKTFTQSRPLVPLQLAEGAKILTSGEHVPIFQNRDWFRVIALCICMIRTHFINTFTL